jgi:hypothetical protein
MPVNTRRKGVCRLLPPPTPEGSSFIKRQLPQMREAGFVI